MTWINKIKLNKQLLRSVADAGFAAPKQIQLKTLPRIIGGQDLIAVAPEGSGKTTTYVLAILNRFNHAPDGVPQALVLLPDKDSVEAVLKQFLALNKNKSLAIVGLQPLSGIEAQMDALANGADIVVATPDRARSIYLKLGLNLNKIQVFVVDDAELMVKQGLQLPVQELANSITKAQRLVFTTVMHNRLSKMVAPFMQQQPPIIEAEETGQTKLNLHPQALYQVPNFGTKLNLLNIFVDDEELFTKMVVFVNSRHTAEKLYKSINTASNKIAALYRYSVNGLDVFNAVEDFKANEKARVLMIVNEDEEDIDLSGVPFLLHFDLPADKEIFFKRALNNTGDNGTETLSIILATDLELDMIRKIEQLSGQKIPVMELPDTLIIEKGKKETLTGGKSTVKTKPAPGAAFHEKKASNSKTYNYSFGTKAKMNKKKKHG